MVFRRLFPILGARAALTFGGVAFLVAALLAVVHLTSRFALKQYVDDQLRRVRWDLAVYQKGLAGLGLGRVPELVRSVDGVQQVESLAFLRAEFPIGGEVTSLVDGQPLTTPWVSLLASSDLSILPPQLRFALSRGGAEESNGGSSGHVAAGAPVEGVLALVGPEREIGKAFLNLQGAKQFSVNLKLHHGEKLLFDAAIKQVIRLEREELIRWVMDQTGSITYVPHVGAILLMPYRPDILLRFDTVAAGLVPTEMLGPGDGDFGHVQEAEYEPEMAYLARVDRDRIISGWDIGGSLDRMMALNHNVHDAARETERQFDGLPSTPTVAPSSYSPPPRVRYLLVHDPPDMPSDRKALPSRFIVDSTTEVLLMRMERLSRVVGLVTLLVALPLLWVAWLLAGNLAGLLMLNERRLLGLMRLRGISGAIMGRTLLVAIVAGGTIGGLLGLVVGSVGALAVYERGRVPLDVLLTQGQLLAALEVIGISVLMAYFASRRLIKYATTISPLAASGRVAASDAQTATIRFGIPQIVSLVVGSYVLFSWIVRDVTGVMSVAWLGRLLDFVGLPLFVYGVAALLVSRRAWMEAALAPMARMAGGRLGRFADRHIAVKPHRTLAFLLIVALMVTVSLYPLITSHSFEDKAARGAKVQIGADWQLLFNSPDLVDVGELQGSLRQQREALAPQIEKLARGIASVPGVTNVTHLVEAVLPNFYLPDYGLRGVPAYLVDDTRDFLEGVYHEPEIGLTDSFSNLAARLDAGDVVVSPIVAQFKKLQPGSRVRLGVDTNRRSVGGTTGGVIALLPGIPPRTVTDRQGYVQARIDYLNHLFSNNAYVVALADNPRIEGLRVLIPRVIFLVRTDPASLPVGQMRDQLLAALPFPPLEVHNIGEEVGKVASDMYISLALANMRIYLFGGIVLAVVAIFSVAAANYAEDRRTLALLRIRGVSPQQLWRFMLALLLSPALLGLLIGTAVAVLAGYGLANHVWELREIKTVVQLLRTRLVFSTSFVSVALSLIALLIAAVTALSWWVYQRTAHQKLRGV